MGLGISSMSNKLCIAVCVYGRKYQCWIPLYIYSINNSYPDYDIKVFVDKKMSIGIRKLLGSYNLYQKAEFIENIDFTNRYGLKSDIEKRCFRWLCEEERFDGYDYVYWGDIDIFIQREKTALLKQHISDMSRTGRCYSNALRLRIKDYFSDRDNLSVTHLFRLTGLHFIKKREYYKKVNLVRTLILKYLKGRRIEVIDKLFFRDDERCLWVLNFLSKTGIPDSSYEISLNAFRPLHGLHFAIGREYATYKKLLYAGSIHYLEHELYFNQFCYEYNNDPVLRRLIMDSSYYVISIIAKACNVWEGKLTADGIIKE
ncbi:hypothetical protein QYZ88_006340 [Lachnospiraceae bacterium C1.1]|nr:hypothetical protein [Lachnospiraceae bacterium C1.1]